MEEFEWCPSWLVQCTISIKLHFATKYYVFTHIISYFEFIGKNNDIISGTFSRINDIITASSTTITDHCWFILLSSTIPWRLRIGLKLKWFRNYIPILSCWLHFYLVIHQNGFNLQQFQPQLVVCICTTTFVIYKC